MKLLPSIATVKQLSENWGRIKRRSFVDIAMLYASKVGAIIVGVLILPQFNQLLGPSQFGVAAIFFSLQALLLILDLGMSTIVGRDIAANDGLSDVSINVWRSAEVVLSIAYAVLGLIFISIASLVGGSLTTLQMILFLVALWALTQQNVTQAVLLAKRSYLQAGVLQLLGVLVRGGGALVTMMLVGATLQIFLISQCILAFAHYIVSRIYCNRLLVTDNASSSITLNGCLKLFNRGKPLLLFGIAGAAVMQLDKPIISLFMSPAELGPYYLAMVLCLTPISTLAAPIMQFFQPRLIRAIHEKNHASAGRVFQWYSVLVTLLTLIPTGILWLFRDPLIHLWLQHGSGIPQVIEYAGILLPGIALGALGYIPYVLLVAHQDFRFQAQASAIMTVITLGVVLFAASRASIVSVCWVYAYYHSMSMLISWLRCLAHENSDKTQYVKRNAILTGFLAMSCLALIIALYILLRIF